MAEVREGMRIAVHGRPVRIFNERGSGDAELRHLHELGDEELAIAKTRTRR
jgi:hypothetical protein